MSCIFVFIFLLFSGDNVTGTVIKIYQSIAIDGLVTTDVAKATHLTFVINYISIVRNKT